MSKFIKLTQNQVSVVDDEDFEGLSRHKWYAMWNPSTKSFYACRNIWKLGKQKRVFMHRVIAETPDEMRTDHENHDTLDNRRKNLRHATRSQNAMNKGKQRNNKSGYKGVFPNKNRWMSRIVVDGRNIYLGTWKSKEDAAIAYDAAAKKYHGEFANLNFS